MIDAIPKQMRDPLFEELNQWHNSDERQRWIKAQKEQAGKRTAGIPLLSDYGYQQAKTPELLNMP